MENAENKTFTWRMKIKSKLQGTEYFWKLFSLRALPRAQLGNFERGALVYLLEEG